MVTIPMFMVEWSDHDEEGTFELFEQYKDALLYVEKIKDDPDIKVITVNYVQVDPMDLYLEEGSLNYSDTSSLIQESHWIRNYLP